MRIGVSTGGIARGDAAAGVAQVRSLGLDVVELSALAEEELPSVTLALKDLDGFSRASVHGPAKGRVLPEEELVSQLSLLEADVVMHPDVIRSLASWRPLGERLLVENNDSRKVLGSSLRDLDEIFALLPAARLCLDVSHALDVGGPEHVLALARRFHHRLAQLHVGCASGKPVPPHLSQEELTGVRAVCDLASEHLPVVLERVTTHVEPLLEQLRALP